MAGKPAARQRAYDRHHLYELSVQNVDADLDFGEKVYRRRHGKAPLLLREDFCGTALLSCVWVRRRPENRALGVDSDAGTLERASKRNVAVLGRGAERLELACRDVSSLTRPRADLTMALNFSYWVWKTRPEMLAYFRVARAALRPGGILVLDLFGGTEAAVVSQEEREVEADSCFDGTRVPAFTYIWDQASFNPISHDFQCSIHFRLEDGTLLRQAFHYDWRFWMLPELRELLAEAGFARSEVYMDDWDEEQADSNGIFRRRRDFDNEGVWVGYLVGLT